MTEEEIKLLQDKLDFAQKNSQEAIARFFEQQKKIRELYKQIAEADAKYEREVATAVKTAKWEATVSAVSSVCDTIDDCIGMHAYEYTDRIRASYKIPTKWT